MVDDPLCRPIGQAGRMRWLARLIDDVSNVASVVPPHSRIWPFGACNSCITDNRGGLRIDLATWMRRPTSTFSLPWLIHFPRRWNASGAKGVVPWPWISDSGRPQKTQRGTEQRFFCPKRRRSMHAEYFRCTSTKIEVSDGELRERF